MAEPNREDEGNRGVENEAGSGECPDLRTPPEMMLDLARRAAELLVARTENLPEEGAWDGEFHRAVGKGGGVSCPCGEIRGEEPEPGTPDARVPGRGVFQGKSARAYSGKIARFFRPHSCVVRFH